MGLHVADRIEVKQNLKLVARERGKIVQQRIGHNIWLDLGREWLAKLISLDSYGPDVPRRNDRIKYMGLGIGGTRQLALPTANSAPIAPPYTGTNVQTDTDPAVVTLERPIRISGSSSNYPGLAGDAWVGLVQAPADFSVPHAVTYTRLFTEADVNYGPFHTMPLSEIGLLTSAADPENWQNTLVAYDTFDTISKTPAVAIEVTWTIRF
jgi:hypothetical protein